MIDHTDPLKPMPLCKFSISHMRWLQRKMDIHLVHHDLAVEHMIGRVPSIN
jgi:hypothetical protein